MHTLCCSSAGPTFPSAGGVPSLHHEALDDAVEDGVVIVALKAQLHKVAHGLQGSAAGDHMHVARA